VIFFMDDGGRPVSGMLRECKNIKQSSRSFCLEILIKLYSWLHFNQVTILFLNVVISMLR
jgi:hypothetical protein